MFELSITEPGTGQAMAVTYAIFLIAATALVGGLLRLMGLRAASALAAIVMIWGAVGLLLIFSFEWDRVLLIPSVVLMATGAAILVVDEITRRWRGPRPMHP